MKILFYGINYKPELTGIGKYTGEMVEWFAQYHQVKVITSVPYYPAWKVADGYRNCYSVHIDNGVNIYRCPLYIPQRPNIITRLIHLVSFAMTSFFMMARLIFWRPNIIFVVEPTFFCTPLALLYARLTGAKAILHIQDYEIDAMFGLGLMSQGLLGRIAKVIERWLMSRFDKISTISNSMMRLAQEKGVGIEKIVFFPNWVDTDFISPDVDRSFFRRKWQIAESTQVILYSGNMGKKQGLELVLEAAEYFRDRPNLLFLMVGQGAAYDDLQFMAKTKNLKNVRFESLQPYSELPMLLALADIHLVVQKLGAADVVLPSKLTGILSVGGMALITAEEHTELGQLVKQFPRIACCVEPENKEAFIHALGVMLNNASGSVNHVARKYAEEFLNQDAILNRFKQEVESLIVK